MIAALRRGAAAFIAASLLVGALASVAHAAPETMEARNGAKLRVLDKITARTTTVDVKLDQTVSFASLRITLRACRENPPTEAPESAAFLEIAEQAPEGGRKVFSGWMFASSPALSAMEHAVYDVWVLGCLGG
ncbi:MAG TPA: DUF2155 domain-containing protein [Azospirillaceae bacterium]|nr:DUF2155 domain-containing protein [Azospirillaceae bacterium]